MKSNNFNVFNFYDSFNRLTNFYGGFNALTNLEINFNHFLTKKMVGEHGFSNTHWDTRRVLA